MGIKKKILLIYDVRCEHLIQKIKACKKDLSIENVHQFRTKTRQINCMVEVFEKYFENEEIKDIKKILVPIFKSLGILRDTQLQLEYLEESDISKDKMPIYLEQLLKQEEKQLIRSKEKISEIDLENLQKILDIFRNELKKLFKGNKNRQTLLKKLKKEYKNIYNKVCKKSRYLVIDDPKTFHDLRKIFKKFRYTMEIMAPIHGMQGDQHKIIKKIQDALGEIQDLNVRINQMKKIQVVETDTSIDKLILENEKQMKSKMEDFYRDKVEIKELNKFLN